VREISTLLYAHAVPAEERSERMTFARMRLHLISGIDDVSQLGISSKFNAELPLLEHLHACGVAAAERWLAEHGDQLGRRSTLDTRKVFL
jgi:NTE family protein